jgi:hypothetical protein
MSTLNAQLFDSTNTKQYHTIDIPSIDGNEELDYIAININDDSISRETIVSVIEAYYSLIDAPDAPSNPECHYNLLSGSLGVMKSTIKKIFDAQLEFLQSKNIAH